MDNSTAWDGIKILLLCSSAPFLTGFVLAWVIRGRIDEHGLLGLLPKFIRELLEAKE